jgi:hypothetical protein
MKSLIFFIGVLLLFACSNKSYKKENQQNTTQIKIAAYNVEYSKNATAAEIGGALNLTTSMWFVFRKLRVVIGHRKLEKQWA